MVSVNGSARGENFESIEAAVVVKGGTLYCAAKNLLNLYQYVQTGSSFQFSFSPMISLIAATIVEAGVQNETNPSKLNTVVKVGFGLGFSMGTAALIGASLPESVVVYTIYRVASDVLSAYRKHKSLKGCNYGSAKIPKQ